MTGGADGKATRRGQKSRRKSGNYYLRGDRPLVSPLREDGRLCTDFEDHRDGCLCIGDEGARLGQILADTTK